MSDVKDVKQIQNLTVKKMELAQKVREIRAEIGKLNSELAKVGADSHTIACW